MNTWIPSGLYALSTQYMPDPKGGILSSGYKRQTIDRYTETCNTLSVDVKSRNLR